MPKTDSNEFRRVDVFTQPGPKADIDVQTVFVGIQAKADVAGLGDVRPVLAVKRPSPPAGDTNHCAMSSGGSFHSGTPAFRRLSSKLFNVVSCMPMKRPRMKPIESAG